MDVVLLVLLLAVSPPQTTAETSQQLFLRGEQALAEGRYDEAASAYEELRRLAPETAEVHGRLGLIYYQQRRYEPAVASLQRALELSPDLPNAGVLLGMSLSELGRFEEALGGLREGFGLPASDALKRACGLELLRALTGLGQVDQAVGVGLELAQLYPDDPEILYHTGRIFSHFAYLQTIKLSRIAPDSVWLHQAAGEANASRGLYQAAIREYRAVLTKAPKRPGIRFRIGRCLVSEADQASSPDDASRLREEASQELVKELAQDPTNANAAYELGEIHRVAGRLDAARRWFEQAVEYYPDFEQARIALGRVLLAEREPEAALEQLEAAAALNPDNPVTFYQLSSCYRALGNVPEQKRALAEFQRLKRGASAPKGPPAYVPMQVTEQRVEGEQDQ